MFNDEPYGLTDAVLSGLKTQTRRIVPDSHLTAYEKYRAENKDAAMSLSDFLIRRGFARYVLGEVVAIAQSYKSIGLSPSFVSAKKDHEKKHHTNTPIGQQAGWSNKVYVAADFMPHHIKITGVGVEKLQSISDEDIAAFMAEDVESNKPFLMSDLDLTQFEIIGDIHTSPDLLKGGRNG